MAKKISKLQEALQQVEDAVKETNSKINELGFYANFLYYFLNKIQSLFDLIRNVPEDDKLKYEELKQISVNWKQQAEKIELEYKKAEVKTKGQGLAGVGVGVAVVAFGPTAAMGIATTFGVASTGTAISALSGAAATNAALAWLGGGALAAGGGGMIAGHALLGLAGPVGWAVAGLSLAASGLMLFKTKGDREKLENIYTLISKRDTKSYELAIVELDERIKRILDENRKLEKAIDKIKSFGTDYNKMSEPQQYELGAYVNLMEASTMLLVNPILGLQPKYSEQDFEKLCAAENDINRKYFKEHKNLVVYMANLLYEIRLDDNDKKLFVMSLQKNKEFLSSVEISKKEIGVHDIDMIEKALNYRYKFSAY